MFPKQQTLKIKQKRSISSLQSVFSSENLENIPVVDSSPDVEVLSTIDIRPEIVKGKLRALDSNKSPGHDELHPHFLRAS